LTLVSCILTLRHGSVAALHPGPGAIVIGNTYVLVLWIVQKVEKVPKSYRFSVGRRLIDAALNMLLFLVETAYRRDKREVLGTASVLHDGAPVPGEARPRPEPSGPAYAFAAEHLDEVGWMVGGWERGAWRPPAGANVDFAPLNTSYAGWWARSVKSRPGRVPRPVPTSLGGSIWQ
jgi:hypothetical protein